MAQKVIHWVSGTFQTVGLVTGTICSYDLSSTAASPTGTAFNNCSVYAEANIVGYNTGTSDGGTQKIVRGFKRVSGTLTSIDAATITLVTGTLGTGIATSVFNITTSGNLIICQATGVLANTIDWFCDMRLRIYQP